MNVSKETYNLKIELVKAIYEYGFNERDIVSKVYQNKDLVESYEKRDKSLSIILNKIEDIIKNSYLDGVHNDGKEYNL